MDTPNNEIGISFTLEAHQDNNNMEDTSGLAEELMNENLRLEVLRHSLAFEFFINKILSRLLNVEGKVVRTLGHTSESVPFRSKLNLLFDIGYFDNTEVKMFNAVMEVRNKFLHVLELNSYEKACNSDLQKSLLVHNSLPESNSLESRLESGYLTLVEKCLAIVGQKVQQLDSELKAQHDYLVGIAQFTRRAAQSYWETVDAVNTKIKAILNSDDVNHTDVEELQSVLIVKFNEYKTSSEFIKYNELIDEKDTLEKVMDKFIRL